MDACIRSSHNRGMFLKLPSSDDLSEPRVVVDSEVWVHGPTAPGESHTGTFLAANFLDITAVWRHDESVQVGHLGGGRVLLGM